MEASIVDLRYKMKDVLCALERNEQVKIYFHGKLKGTIQPVKEKSKKNVKESPFFGMLSNDQETVEETMQRLRGSRHVI